LEVPTFVRRFSPRSDSREKGVCGIAMIFYNSKENIKTKKQKCLLCYVALVVSSVDLLCEGVGSWEDA
jgi:hypothetical protein